MVIFRMQSLKKFKKGTHIAIPAASNLPTIRALDHYDDCWELNGQRPVCCDFGWALIWAPAD